MRHGRGVLWLAAVCAGGCDIEPPRTGPPGPFLMSLRPHQDERDVDRNLDLEAEFDAPLDPSSVHRNTIRLTSGPLVVAGDVRYDPVRFTAHLRPTGPLDPQLDYRFTVTDGVHGLDGSTVRGSRSAEFRTGDLIGPDPPSCRYDFGVDVLGFLRTRCSVAGCHHARDAVSGLDPPVMGLDLSDVAGLRETLVAERSREWWSYGRPWLRVEPGRPEWSYVVYKLVGDVPTLIGEPMHFGCVNDSSCPTLDRVDAIACWIRDGAPLP